jgi:uncharacterized protein (DUF2345 family)
LTLSSPDSDDPFKAQSRKSTIRIGKNETITLDATQAAGQGNIEIKAKEKVIIRIGGNSVNIDGDRLYTTGIIESKNIKVDK